MALKRLLLFAFLAIFVLAAPRVLTQPASETREPLLLVELTGVIGPPIAHHVESAVKASEQRRAQLLILQINTPGGLETSMRDIVEDILRSNVPIVGYVAPSGGRAASAGAFILLSTHIAAMAPGTNVGAATPVQLDGSDVGDAKKQPASDKGAPASGKALERKAVNDAAAFIRSLSELRGRNVIWAEKAVRDGAAISAHEALQQGVIDLVAEDIDDLLTKIDGRVVTTPRGKQTLSTRGLAIERLEPSVVTKILGAIANPNVAFLLMMIGLYGIIYEFASPGFIGPGVIGAIALVLGLYALNQLPLNYAGVALVAIGLAFMVAEAFTPSFGVLALGGAAAFIMGAAMLIDTDLPQYRLSLAVIITAATVTSGFSALALSYAVRAHRKPATTGRDGLIGQRGEVLDWSSGAGHVWVQGERWRAIGPDMIPAGRCVRVTAIESLTLHVAADTT